MSDRTKGNTLFRFSVTLASMGIIQSFRNTMILNIAELIKGFIDEEARNLSEFDIKHGPENRYFLMNLTSLSISRRRAIL